MDYCVESISNEQQIPVHSLFLTNGLAPTFILGIVKSLEPSDCNREILRLMALQMCSPILRIEYLDNDEP